MSLSYRSTRPLPVISQVGIAASGNSGDLAVDGFDQLALDVNVSALTGTSPSVTFVLNRKGADGVYYPIWTSAAQTAVGKLSTSAGISAPINHCVGSVMRLDWMVAGTSVSLTFTASLIGK